MSYEISLYRRDFLNRALREQLGDWTVADPISQPSRDTAEAFLLDRGYAAQNYPWQADCQTYQHPVLKHQVEVTIFDGCISFAIQNSETALDDINLAIEAAVELGRLTDLVVFDPQDGRIIETDAPKFG